MWEQVGVVACLHPDGVEGAVLLHPCQQGAAEHEPAGADGRHKIGGGRDEQRNDRPDGGE
jgi:hypothetical protein